MPRNTKRCWSSSVLVPRDVKGPCRTTFLRGFKYAVTFIYDYSRVTWLFLVKYHLELVSICWSFSAEVKIQYCSIWRRNNFTQYFFTLFVKFISNSDYSLISCVYVITEWSCRKKESTFVKSYYIHVIHMNVSKQYGGIQIYSMLLNWSYGFLLFWGRKHHINTISSKVCLFFTSSHIQLP